MPRILRYWPAAAIAALSTFLVLLAQGTYVPSGVFNSATPMTVARDGASSAVLIDGSILVSGGKDDSGNPLDSAEILGGSSAGQMHAARAGHVSVTLSDGTVLVAGGSTTGRAATNATEVYDPSAGAWTVAAHSMLEARIGATATLLSDGRVLIAGGDNGSGPVQTTEIYDPASGVFSSGSPLSSARKNHAAALLHDGRVAIAGGMGVGSDGQTPLPLNTIDIYDPVANTATQFAAAMAAPRVGLSATTLLKGQVLLAGGGTTAGAASATTDILDVTAGTVAPGPGMSAARASHLALLLPNNNTVLMVSGASDSAAAEIYVPWQNVFTPFGTLAAARTDAAGGASGQMGAASIAGGEVSGTASSVVETIHFPMVKTDKPDYMPGETAQITGSGFAPGEVVNLSIEEIPDLDADSPIQLQATADALGNISTTLPIDTPDLGIRFYLTATGATSKLTAGMTFTDNKNLTITFAGTGAGSVSLSDTTNSSFNTSIPSTCISPHCDMATGNSDVGTLTATASAGSTFAGWSLQSAGIMGCSGSTCNFSMGNSGQSVTATFNAVTLLSQTITVDTPAPGSATYGSSFNVAAHASSLLAVTVAGSGGCTGSGTTTGAGSPVSITMTSSTTACTVTYSQAGNGTYSAATNVVSSTTALKAPVTATAGSYSGTYDASTHSPSACVVSGAYTTGLSCTNTPTSVGPGAGSGTVTPTVVGDTTNFIVTPANGSWSIAQAPVTATAGSYSGTYDGNTHPPSACVVTGTFTTGETCTNSPVSVGPGFGSGTVTPVASDTTNFIVTPVNGSWSIAKAPVTATAGSYSGTYDASTHSPSACVVSGTYTTGLSCTNTPTSVGPGFGSGTVTPAVVGDTTNFIVTPANGSWSIAKAPVTATAGGYSGTYDGNTHSPSACAVTGTYTGSLTCTDNPAAVGPNVGSGTVTPSVVGDTTNFTVTPANGSWSITAAPVTFTAGSFTGFWDGSAHSPSPCMVTGVYTGPLTCTNNPASVGPAVGSGTVNPVPNYGGDTSSNYTPTLKTGSWVINRDTTMLTYTGPITSMYGQCGTINLSAVLTNTILGGPVSGATVTFTIPATGGALPSMLTGTAVTDNTGTAYLSLNLPSTWPAGSTTVTASFAGSATLAPAISAPPTPYVINPSTMLGPIAGQALYTGTPLVWTSSSTNNTATVTLSTTVEDLAGCSGNIATSKVTFAIRNGTSWTPIPSAQNLPVGLVSPTNPYVGTASAIVQLSTGNSTYAQFDIAVIFGGNYNLNNPAYDQIITVAEPGQAASIIGDGTVDLNASLPAAGYLATGAGTGSSAIPSGAVNYMKVAAGVTYNKSFTNPQGKVQLMFNSYNRPDGTVDTKLHTYQITSTAIASLTSPVKGSTYYFSGKSVVQDLTTGTSVDGGATFQMTTINPDSTHPNGQANIEVQSKSGIVWIIASWNGTQPQNKPIISGGIAGQ